MGVYSVATDFSRQTILLLIGSVSLAGQPLALRLIDTEGPEAARVQLRHNARLIFGVALPAATAVITLATPIAQVFFGSRFQHGAGTVMALITASASISCLRTFYFDQAFELVRVMRPQAIITALATLLGAALGILLIPRYAAIGAGISALIAMSFGCALSVLWGRRVFALPIPLGTIRNVAFATAGMFIAVKWLPTRSGIPGLAVSLAICGIAYGVLLTAGNIRTISARLASGAVWS